MKRFIVGLVLLGAVLTGHAEVPQLINYQGRLLNGTNLVNGNVGLSLRLFANPSGGVRLYEDSNTVTVVDGLYATFLGDDTTAGALAVALTNAQLWIEVAVNGVTLTPRERLAAVGSSLATRGLALTTNDSTVLHPSLNAVASAAANATISGGSVNTIDAFASLSSIGGGVSNAIGTSAAGSTIPGGWMNAIGSGATFSLAAGRQAKANHAGTFVWADNQGVDFASKAPNQFLVRAGGGVGIGTNVTPEKLTVAGNVKANNFIGNGATLTNIGSAALAIESVGPAQLQDESVNTTHIAPEAILNDHIAFNAAINASKIANTSLVRTTVFAGDVTGTVAGLQLAGSVVGNAELAANAVTGDKIATNVGVWARNGSVISYSDGNIGVGTAAPGGAMHVYRATNELHAYFESDAGDAQLYVDGTDDASVTFRRVGADKGTIGYRNLGDYLFLWNGGYVVLKAGDLGVGTGTPETKLHVVGDITVNQKIIADDSGGLELATDEGMTRLRVADDGKIGIGTALPASALHVFATNGNTVLTVDSYNGDARVNVDAATGTPAVVFLRDHAVQATVGYSIASNYVFINEGGSNVVFDNGKVGIGTTSPSNSLTVNGSVSVSGPCYGTFPRPAYDSGWLVIPLVTTLQHNVGGNVDNYVVDIQFKDDGHLGINKTSLINGDAAGGFYSNLDANSVVLWAFGEYAEQGRLRIWTYQ